MGYKVFKSQKLRFRILNLLSWVPDKTMVKIQYWIKLGRKLNLKNPKRFTEKLQWYKINYRNPIMTQCVDKYEVRKYVESKGLGSILNELYGVYDSSDEIDFDKLPDKFVIKTTAGSGGQNVIICKNKNKLNIDDTKEKLKYWLTLNPKKSFGREWAYEGIKNRIIVEKLIEPAVDGLIDFKFFCFDGVVKYLYAISERDLGKMARLGIYDENFKKLDIYRCDELKQISSIARPENFDEMKRYASTLSKDFPHARIDFYDSDGKIVFGEITFYDGSGYMSFTPDSFDFELGGCFKVCE